MIGTVLRIGWLGLRRDRISLALTFALPIIFFSIFAVIFGGGQKNQATSRIKLLLVDEDQTEVSRRFADAVAREPTLSVHRSAADPKNSTPAKTPLTREDARLAVRDGKFSVALVLPKGLGESFPNFSGSGSSVELLADTSDQIAPQVVGGLLQKVVMTGVPDLIMGSGLSQFEKFAGEMTPQQRKAVDEWLPMLKHGTANWLAPADNAQAKSGSSGPGMSGLVSVRIIDVLGANKNRPLIAFYAAGTCVMFLLFMCAGAGGSLLEEVESGTLDRLLSSRLGMSGLLAGKWLFLTLVGIAQTVVMFVWGAVVFQLDLWTHLPGFAVMTLATTSAASGFGLLLATLCRSRGQLSGLSTIVILVMSAIGGSMFPRFLMSESLQRFGLLTFNAWALDGYVKVFWRDLPVTALGAEVGVLCGCAILFFTLARFFARRWETS